MYKKLKVFNRGIKSVGEQRFLSVLQQLVVVQYAKALHMSWLLTANNQVLRGLHFLVVSQGAFVFTRSLSADGSQSVGVRIFHQHFLALVAREEGDEEREVISGNEKEREKEERVKNGVIKRYVV